MRPHCRRRTITRPLLVVPYMWIGDFMRGHTVIRVLKTALAQSAHRYAGHFPVRPAGRLHARRSLRPSFGDLPRSRLAVARQWELAGAAAGSELRHRDRPAPHLEIGRLPPRLAGIPERVGFCRRSQIRPDQTDGRWGEKGPGPASSTRTLPLALPEGTPLPPGMAGAAAQCSRRGKAEPLAASEPAGQRSPPVAAGSGIGRHI